MAAVVTASPELQTHDNDPMQNGKQEETEIHKNASLQLASGRECATNQLQTRSPLPVLWELGM